MKIKGIIIAIVSVVLLAVVAFLAIDYNDKVEEKTSIAKSELKKKEAKESKEETDGGSATDSGTSPEAGHQAGAAVNDGATTSAEENLKQGETASTEAAGTVAGSPASGNTAGNSSTNQAANVTPSQPTTGGLHFATREEAVAFGFSRFTAEEIELYNRASANGLTPEQEEMAIQIAYSRFSSEEIAAIEEALNR
ncbi:hypothetical protein [Niallia oryzisoli]|uniref:hypothetical protein n=1 Tax=Niallia oryzisoli TaxID=1737571 RepID=UPI003735D970